MANKPTRQPEMPNVSHRWGVVRDMRAGGRVGGRLGERVGGWVSGGCWVVGDGEDEWVNGRCWVVGSCVLGCGGVVVWWCGVVVWWCGGGGGWFGCVTHERVLDLRHSTPPSIHTCFALKYTHQNK